MGMAGIGEDPAEDWRVQQGQDVEAKGSCFLLEFRLGRRSWSGQLSVCISLLSLRSKVTPEGLGSQKPGISAWPWLCCSISETTASILCSPSLSLCPYKHRHSLEPAALFEPQAAPVESPLMDCMRRGLQAVWEETAISFWSYSKTSF